MSHGLAFSSNGQAKATTRQRASTLKRVQSIFLCQRHCWINPWHRFQMAREQTRGVKVAWRELGWRGRPSWSLTSTVSASSWRWSHRADDSGVASLWIHRALLCWLNLDSRVLHSRFQKTFCDDTVFSHNIRMWSIVSIIIFNNIKEHDEMATATFF